VSSAIYYADTGMKTKENFFKGFPVVWNMIVFTLFVIEPGEWVSFGVVLIAGINSRLGFHLLPLFSFSLSLPPFSLEISVYDSNIQS